jgi:hypothetical protein
MISLARSGTHWLKFMVTDLLGTPPHEGRLLEVNQLDFALKNTALTHLCYDHLDWNVHSETVAAYSADLRVLMLLRNPLDVLVSTFHYLEKMGWLPDPGLSVDDNLRLYVRVHWHKNEVVVSPAFRGHWLYQMSMRDYFFRCAVAWLDLPFVRPVFFEKLIEDPCQEMQAIMQFLGHENSLSEIEAVVKHRSFEVLSGGRKRGQEDLSSHYRKGMTGEGLSFFSKEELVMIDSQIGDFMVRLGYSIPGSVTRG